MHSGPGYLERLSDEAELQIEIVREMLPVRSVEPEVAFLRLPSRNLQPLLTPDPLNAFDVHRQNGDPYSDTHSSSASGDAGRTLDHDTITKPTPISPGKLTERLSSLTSIAMDGDAEMNDVLRNGLAAISEAMNGKGLEGQEEKVDAILDAISEAVADVLPTATVSLLKNATEAVKATLRDLQRATPIDEASVSYVAGRLTATADILGYAAYRTGDETALQIAKTQPFAKVLDLLAEKPMRNVDLAKAMARDEAQVSKWLGKLRDAGAVVSHRQGREIFNGLTPIGRLVVEDGWQDERRANLATINVLSLDANRYDMSVRSSPQGVTGAELPRLSATA